MVASRVQTPLLVLGIVGAAAAAISGVRHWQKRQNQLITEDEEKKAALTDVYNAEGGQKLDDAPASFEEVQRTQLMQEVQTENVSSQEVGVNTLKGQVADALLPAVTEPSVQPKVLKKRILKRRKVKNTGTSKTGVVKQGGKAGGVKPGGIEEVAAVVRSKQVQSVPEVAKESGKLQEGVVLAARAVDDVTKSGGEVAVGSEKTVHENETVTTEQVAPRFNSNETAGEGANVDGNAAGGAKKKTPPTPFLGMKRGFLGAGKRTFAKAGCSSDAESVASMRKSEGGVARVSSLEAGTESKGKGHSARHVEQLQERASEEGANTVSVETIPPLGNEKSCTLLKKAEQTNPFMPPEVPEQDAFCTPPKEKRVSIEVSKEPEGSPERTPRSILNAFPDSPESERGVTHFPEGPETPSDMTVEDKLGPVFGDSEQNEEGLLSASVGETEGGKLSDCVERAGPKKPSGELNFPLKQEDTAGKTKQGGKEKGQENQAEQEREEIVENETKVAPFAKRQLSLQTWLESGEKRAGEGPAGDEGKAASVQEEGEVLWGVQEQGPPAKVEEIEGEQTVEEQGAEQIAHSDIKQEAAANEVTPALPGPTEALQNPTAPHSQTSGDHAALDLASNEASGPPTPAPASETYSVDGSDSGSEIHAAVVEFAQAPVDSEQESKSADDFVMVDHPGSTNTLPNPELQTDDNQQGLAKPTDAFNPPSKCEIEEALDELPEGGSVPVVSVPPESDNVAAAAQVLCSWCGHSLGDTDDDELALCCMLALQKLQDAQKRAVEEKTKSVEESPASKVLSTKHLVGKSDSVSANNLVGATNLVSGSKLEGAGDFVDASDIASASGSGRARDLMGATKSVGGSGGASRSVSASNLLGATDFVTASNSFSASEGLGGDAKSQVEEPGQGQVTGMPNGEETKRDSGVDERTGQKENGSAEDRERTGRGSVSARRRESQGVARKATEGTWAAKVRWWLDGMSN